MSWKNDRYEHSLASKGIKTKGMIVCKRPASFFKSTDKSIRIPLSNLKKSHEPSEKKKDSTREKMQDACEGTGKRRKPVKVARIMENGKFRGDYLVLDGNTTITVAPEFGLTHVIATVKEGN